MEIERMDASRQTSYPQKSSGATPKEAADSSASIGAGAAAVSDHKSLSQMTSYEKSELPVAEKLMIQAIEKANRAISGANRKFEFSIHEKTKEIMIKVIDSDTNEVIREIPPENILDMVAKMWEMAGILVDERR